MSYQNCLSVSLACPVSATIYGYYPSLGANAFFCGFFGLALFVNLFLGLRYKTWTFTIALALGSLTECIGYVGRILLHSNPWVRTTPQRYIHQPPFARRSYISPHVFLPSQTSYLPY